MNEKEYLKICRICNEFLIDKNATIERIANPLFHVLKPHPIFLERYEEVISKNNYYIFRLLKNLIKIGIVLIKSLKNNNNYWEGSISNNLEILIISHHLNQKLEEKKITDIYYEKIIEKLATQKIKFAIGIINHTSISEKKLAIYYKKEGEQRIILNKILNFKNELKILIKCMIESYLLWITLGLQKNEIKKKLILSAISEVYSYGATKNLRMFEQTKQIINKTNPKIIILTFEGHSWERMVFAAAKQINPKIICIGYQHSVIFKLQNAIYTNLMPDYLPDVILTSGTIGKNEVKKNIISSKQITTLELGSSSYTICKPIKEINKNKTCIVLPEGILNECNILFKYSIKCAKKYPNIKFIWRLHPSLSFNQLRKKYNYKNLPDNIELSKDKLENDLEKSHWALYRGSSTIIQAIMRGVRPIYLSIDNEISIDPIFRISTSHIITNSVDDFSKIIKNEDFYLSNIENFQNHCNKIFTPLNIDPINHLLLQNTN